LNVVASVIIPTGGPPGESRDRIMAGAVLSCLGQTLQDIEVIVVDDATTDHTADILEILRKYDPRLRVLRLPVALGISGGLQRNEGVKIAKGKYIAYLDDDDVMTPWALEHRVKVMDARPDIDFCWSRTMFVRNQGPDWENSVHERLVAEPKFGPGIPWQLGTVIPDELMHRAGVVGAKSGIWWTPGRGEDQRLVAEMLGRGFKGVPVDTLGAIYGRGSAFRGLTTADRARRARLQRAERARLADVDVQNPATVTPRRPAGPAVAPTRLPTSFSDRLAARNARRASAKQETTDEAPAPTGVMPERRAGDAPMPSVRRDDEAVGVPETPEVEV